MDVGDRQRGGQQQAHAGRRHDERHCPDRDRRVEVGSQLRIDRALERERRSGQHGEREPGAAVTQPAGRHAAPGLRAGDQRSADQHREASHDLGRTQRLCLHPEPAEAVEHQRGEHLSRDPEAHREHRSEAREQQDAGGDVDSAAEPADEMPGLGAAESAERVERARDRRHREQEGRTDAELERRCAKGTPGRRAELYVRGCLERQQRADEEQKGNRERLHGMDLSRKRTWRPVHDNKPDATSGYRLGCKP